MLDRTYETKQWVSVLLHLAVVCFLLFPLCSPAPMSQSGASMMDLVPSARHSAEARANLSALTETFMRTAWGEATGGSEGHPTDRTNQTWSEAFQDYLQAILPNPASWQSPLRLSYGLLGTCFVQPSFNAHNHCTGSSLHPRLSIQDIEHIPWVNSTAYLAASPEELAAAEQNATLATELFVAPLDTSMLPTGWGPVPSLQLAVLVVLVVLLAGTCMPLTLLYIGRRHPMSRFNPTFSPVAERVSIKYQQLHCFLLPLLLAAEFALTVVTRINVGQYVKAFNSANDGRWLPSTAMLDTMASNLPLAIAVRTQSQTALVARAGSGFDLYYTALASHLALVLMCYELYRDDTSRRRVRINHELNWSAHAEMQRQQNKTEMRRHEPRTPHGAARSHTHLVHAGTSPDCVSPTAGPESINYGAKAPGSDDSDRGEVRVQINPPSPCSGGGAHSPISPASGESQGSMAKEAKEQKERSVQRDASLYSVTLAGGVDAGDNVSAPRPRAPPEHLGLSSATSEATFGTFSSLPSPWLVEGNDRSVPMEVLKP